MTRDPYPRDRSGNRGLLIFFLVLITASLFEWRTGFFSDLVRRYQSGPGISTQENRGAAQQIMLGVEANPIHLQVVVGDVVARVQTTNQATRAILWGTIPIGQTTLEQTRTVNPIVSFRLSSLSEEQIREIPGPTGTVLVVTVPTPQVVGVKLPVDSVESREVEKAFIFFGAGEEAVLGLDESSDRDAALGALKQFCETRTEKLSQLLEGENGLRKQLTDFFSGFIKTDGAVVEINFVTPPDGFFIPQVQELDNFSCKM